MHFLENSMFVRILRSKLRFLLRNTGVDSDLTQNFWGKKWRLKALKNASFFVLNVCLWVKWALESVRLLGACQHCYRVILEPSFHRSLTFKPLLNEGVPHAHDWSRGCPELSKGWFDVLCITSFLIGNTISEKEYKEKRRKGVEELVGA